MKHSARMMTVSLMTLALSGVGWAAQKATDSTSSSAAKTEHSVKAENRTATGKISAVDNTAHTLTLTEKHKTVTFHFEDKTLMTEAGHMVQPSALATGQKVTVRYVAREGKDWVSSLSIHSPKPVKSHSLTKTSK